MTLSTSERKCRKTTKTAYIYLLVTIFCILFGYVYELFSHGVYSMPMVYAFVYPLLGGVLPFLTLSILNLTPGSEQLLLHCGVATTTLGSILQGVLEIYGTDNALMLFYPWVSGFLMFSGITIMLIRFFKAKQL